MSTDERAVMWAARLVYCAMTPFVFVAGLVADLHWFILSVAYAVHDAFGADALEIPELAAGILTIFFAFIAPAATLIAAMELMP